jgi:hypothetical protein
LFVKLFPEGADFARVLADKERAVAVDYAIYDESVGR